MFLPYFYFGLFLCKEVQNFYLVISQSFLCFVFYYIYIERILLFQIFNISELCVLLDFQCFIFNNILFL